jgi:hypothetical protein
MASSVTIANLTAKLQEFVADNPKIWSDLYVSMMGIGSYIDVYQDVEDQLPLIKLNVSDPNQPGNRSSFAPKNNVLNFTDRILQVKNCEISLQFKQAEIEAMKRSYVNRMARMMGQGSNAGDVYSMPFEEYMLMEVIKRSADQVRKEALYGGVLNATGTTSDTLFDGYLAYITVLVAATAIPAANVFAGAAISASTALAQFEGVKNKLMATRPDLAKADMVFIAAPENWDFYSQNYRSSFGALNYNLDFVKSRLDGLPTTELINEIGLVGSDRLILTPRYNLVLGTNSMSATENLIIEKEKRDLNVLGDWKMGVNIVDPSLVWTNDQA